MVHIKNRMSNQIHNRMAKNEKDRWQTTEYETQHRKLNIKRFNQCQTI